MKKRCVLKEKIVGGEFVFRKNWILMPNHVAVMVTTCISVFVTLKLCKKLKISL
jgi:hypothetical protein